MHKPQTQVRSFMKRVVGQETPEKPTSLTMEQLLLRLRLLGEEVEEGHAEALKTGSSIARMASELCDILYVTYGFAVSLGVDLEPVFDIIHEANMEKLEGPIDETGKQRKPEGWEDPLPKVRALFEDPDMPVYRQGEGDVVLCSYCYGGNYTSTFLDEKGWNVCGVCGGTGKVSKLKLAQTDAHVKGTF